MFILGMPFLYLEMGLGQMHQKSIPYIFKQINQGYKMIGGTFILVCFHIAGYLNIILTYSYRFLFSAFSYPLPFQKEEPEKNTYFREKVLHSSESLT